jgi:heme oxygenase (biliverdin-IX-beta and delta-forming)
MTHGDLIHSTFTLRDRLKRVTKPFHDQLENTAIARSLAEGSVSRSKYQRYLDHLAALHAHIEEKVQQFSQWKEYNIDITQRVRYPLLKEDLAALQSSESELSIPPLEVPWSFASAVGVMYVLEGSTMGGKILAQRLSHLLGGDALPATRYFQSYGERTMPMWGEYCAFLDLFASRHPESQDQVILSACAMFLLLQRIMDELD